MEMTAEDQVTATITAIEVLIAKIVELGHDLAEEDHPGSDRISQALEDYIAQMQEHTE